jgi:uncharacterized delta-60 repeat protein
LGVFANESGVIVGSPFTIGNGPLTISIPIGSTQLLMGFNDGWYNDNLGGGVNMKITEEKITVVGGSDETATVTLTFSEVPTGFTSSDLTVTGGSLGTLTPDSSGKIYTTTFTPTANTNSLSGTVSVAAGSYTDATGNPGAASNALTFTGDTLAPTLSNSSPSDNTTGVAATANIVLTFNETVQAGTGNIVISNGADTRTIAITDNSQVSISGNTLTINPTADLTAGSTYSIQMASGVIRDTAGNAYVGINDATTLNFTTIDAIAPVFSSGSTATIAENTPPGTTIYDATANNDTGVSYGLSGADANQFTINPNDGTIKLAFVPDYEHPVDQDGNNVYDFTVRATNATGQFTDQAVALTVTDVAESSYVAGQSVIDLGPEYGKLIYPVQVDGGHWYYYWDRSGDGTSANTRGAGYTNATDYTSRDVLYGIFTQDSNGATGGGGTTNNTYRYATLNGVHVALPTTGETPLTTGYRPGTAVGGSPASSGSTAINPTYDDLLAVWDAYNGTGTGTDVNGTPPGWYDTVYFSATPSASGHAAVVLFYGLVGDGDGAYVALEVLSGDTQAPTVTTFSPADNATGIAGNSNLEIAFNEAVLAGTGSIVIKHSVDNSVVESIIANDTSKVTVSGSQVTINPATNLSTGNYFVEIAGNAFSDVAGNAYSGIADATGWNFSVGSAASAIHLNTAINGDGVVVLSDTYSVARSAVLQADGKLVIAGSSINESHYAPDFVVARLNIDGSLDHSFGVDGIQTTNIGSRGEEARSIIQQSDGKLVVAGWNDWGIGDYALVRYNSDGSLDTTFDNDGIVITDLGGAYGERGHSLIQQTDGKLVLAGYKETGMTAEHGYISEFSLARYNLNGSLDTTFDADGIATTHLGEYCLGYSVIQQADGKLVVAGGRNTNYGTDFNFGLARFNNDGSLDTSFGGDGTVTTNFGSHPWGNSNDEIRALLQQPDGKLVAVGSTDAGDDIGLPHLALARYNSNGSLDTTFGSGGKVIVNTGTMWGQDYSVIQQADGKLVVGSTLRVGGDFGQDSFALARFNTDGSLDTTFDNGDGILTTTEGWACTLLQPTEGQLILVGTTYTEGWQFTASYFT